MNYKACIIEKQWRIKTIIIDYINLDLRFYFSFESHFQFVKSWLVFYHAITKLSAVNTASYAVFIKVKEKFNSGEIRRFLAKLDIQYEKQSRNRHWHTDTKDYVIAITAQSWVPMRVLKTIN